MSHDNQGSKNVTRTVPVALPSSWRWTRLHTRLLSSSSASSAWVVWDDPLAKGDLAASLSTELSLYWGQLPAARTEGEALTADVLKILARHRFLATSDQDAATTSGSDTKDVVSSMITTASSLTSTTSSSIRGDKSLFIPRHVRQRTDFIVKFPQLAGLIRAVEAAVATHLPTTFEFDFAQTSVQIAEYPGNGTAEYPRHCDCQDEVCRGGGVVATKTKVDRLLTVLYYLTSEDWDAVQDQGALRLFHSDHEYTDVMPYRNRMVMFRSDKVEHQVLPSQQRPRRALTLWLYGRVKQDEHVAVLSANESVLTKPTAHSWSSNNDPGIAVSQDENGPPPLPVAPSNSKPNDHEVLASIFVSMAAFRDSETGPTLLHMLQTAQFPERVFVGLVLQLNTDEDYDIRKDLPTHLPWYQSNVRVLQLEARHATGPCPARAMAQGLFRHETYVLQIDAHMRFRDNWDSYLIQELASCPTPECCVLSTYPVGYKLPNVIPSETRGTRLYAWKFDDTQMLRQTARFFESPPDKPVMTSLFAAGFCFGQSGWMMRACPYDGRLHHLFFGEELSMALRLYTHGYDMYAPRETVCYHLWSRAHRPAGNPIDVDLRRQSLAIVTKQCTGEVPVNGDYACYGLGTQRSVSQWESSVGVNLQEQRILQQPLGNQDPML